MILADEAVDTISQCEHCSPSAKHLCISHYSDLNAVQRRWLHKGNGWQVLADAADLATVRVRTVEHPHRSRFVCRGHYRPVDSRSRWGCDQCITERRRTRKTSHAA